MKNKKTNDIIDVNEFNKSKEEIRKRLEKNYEEEAEEILSLANLSDEDLVKDYIMDLKRRAHAIEESLSEHTSKKVLVSNKISLENIKQKIGQCVEWLKGFKEIDISFVSGIRYKKMFANKSKEEIVAKLKEMNDIEAPLLGFSTVEQTILSDAAYNYEPVRERVWAIREMNDVEQEKKLSIRKKMKEFFIKLGYIAAEAGFPSLIFGIGTFIATKNIISAVSILGLSEAVASTAGLGFVSLVELYENKKIKREGKKALEDLKEVFTSDEIEKMTR